VSWLVHCNAERRGSVGFVITLSSWWYMVDISSTCVYVIASSSPSSFMGRLVIGSFFATILWNMIDLACISARYDSVAGMFMTRGEPKVMHADGCCADGCCADGCCADGCCADGCCADGCCAEWDVHSWENICAHPPPRECPVTMTVLVLSLVLLCPKNSRDNKCMASDMV
jgi:hypothetical protein